MKYMSGDSEVGDILTNDFREDKKATNLGLAQRLQDWQWR